MTNELKEKFNKKFRLVEFGGNSFIESENHTEATTEEIWNFIESDIIPQVRREAVEGFSHYVFDKPTGVRIGEKFYMDRELYHGYKKDYLESLGERKNVRK